MQQTPEQIVATAIAEDADAIWLSARSGAHMTLFAKVVELVGAAGAGDIVVFGGGIIPDADRPDGRCASLYARRNDERNHFLVGGQRGDAPRT